MRLIYLLYIKDTPLNRIFYISDIRNYIAKYCKMSTKKLEKSISSKKSQKQSSTYKADSNKIFSAKQQFKKIIRSTKHTFHQESKPSLRKFSELNSQQKMKDTIKEVQPDSNLAVTQRSETFPLAINQLGKRDNQNIEFNNKNILNFFNPLQKSQQPIDNQQMNEQFFRKLLQVTTNKLIPSSTHINEQAGYFKDNIIRVQLDTSQDDCLKNKQQHQITSRWLGQIYDKCTSTSFKHYICKNLDYNETKTYCCQQILSNLIQVIKKGRDSKMFKKLPSLTSIDSQSTQATRINKKVVYDIQPMKYINEESSRILDYLCHKYPQTDVQGVNKQVAQIAKSMKIDNWADDEYDLMRLSDIQFKQNQSGDYSKQIMQFLNFLIELPHKKHKKHQDISNYKYFQKVMNIIFDIVNYKDSKNDISRIIDNQGEVNFTYRSREGFSQEELEYKEKVRKYTTVSIGVKIPSNVKQFSQEEIQSGIIKVQNNAVARVIDKWAQELSSKFFDAQKNVLNRIYRFKSAKGRAMSKLNEQSRETLFMILKSKQQNLQKSTNQLKQSIYDLSSKLAKSDNSDILDLHFLEQTEKMVGEFAVKMAEASSQYFIQIIQKQIGLLLEAVQVLKTKWLMKHKFKEAPAYQALDISLISFKIGDLMRCKIISNQQEIIRVLEIFMKLSENWENNQLIKIIRVKNRLETGTRDILINFMFDNICPCELQLAVAEKISQKQQYFDKFNHFLYEIRRAYLGPVMEMCKIWNQYENKSLNFVKQIEKSTKKKLKLKKVSQQFLALDFRNLNNIFDYRLPFVCQSCQIFCPRSNLIYFNSCINCKTYCGYCTKNKVSLNQEGVAQIKKKYIFKKYIIRYSNLQKLLNKISEIKTFDAALNSSSKFQIHIPIKSQLIHLQFSMIVKIERNDNQIYDQWAFVSTKFTQNGTLVQQNCSEKIVKGDNKPIPQKNIITKDQMQQVLSNDYIFYGWDAPTSLLPYPENPSEHYTEMIERFLPFIRKLQQEKGYYNVKIGAVQVQSNKYYFFPFFLVDEVKLSDQLIQKQNVSYMTESLKRREEVMEISNKKMTAEWMQLPKSIRLQISRIVKEMYLDHNLIKNVNFVENLHILKIFHASHNEIEQIPSIPLGLEELKLENNRLNKINSFVHGKIQEYKLTLLNLSFNMITKIENIDEIISLKRLHLHENQIEKIEGLPVNIEQLGIMFNQIRKIENMSHLKKLLSVTFQSNLITKIENLQECESLNSLMLNNNKISKIENLCKLKNLKILHLNYTGLDSTPLAQNSNHFYSGLKTLTKLKRLMMQGNKIKCLFLMIGALPCGSKSKADIDIDNPYIDLQEVSLAENEIFYIDYLEHVMPLVNTINLSKNRIKKINNIVKFPFLIEFNAPFNLISELPSQGWEKLFKLKHLNLSNNNIKRVPNLKPLNFIKYLSFDHNQITCVQAFPQYPFGFPDFHRFINMQSNLLFGQSTCQEDFTMTLQSLQTINQDSWVNLANNGVSQDKLERAVKIKEIYGLSKTKIF